MKKIYIFILITFCLFITGCSSNKVKEAKTLQNFEETCNNNGFDTADNLINYTDKEITGSIIAKIDNEQIEMVIYDSEESAKKVQDGHINDFMSIRNNLVNVKKEKGKNYYSFKMVTNGYYWVSTRIDNTLIFTKIPVDYKEKIDTILDNLNY